jgi:methionyl aminopeptidase
MIELKTPGEIDAMRRAGRIVAGLLQHVGAAARPGVRTRELDEASADYLRRAGAAPAFLTYRGYPATVCVSINDEVVHGIPGERKLRDGDLVSIDAGAVVDGLFADAAVTVSVGGVNAQAQRLSDTTKQALDKGIAAATAGRRLSDISHAVQQVVERAGFSVVRDFVGHGIGHALHEEPPVPNFGPPNVGPRLKVGMVLAIEPMVTMGGHEVRILSDGWTVVTTDRSLAAHFEHTVAITAHGPEVLTEAAG